MRRMPLLAGALASLAAPTAAPASTGGAAAPDERPVARAFSVGPAVLTLGKPAAIRFRVDGPTRRVRVAVALTRLGSAGLPTLVRLGWHSTGRRYVRRWTPRAPRVAAGDYTAALQATDAAGLQLRRTARASGRSRLRIRPAPTPSPAPPPAPGGSGVFPVQGPYSLGGPESRFGAVRTGHSHQGQDISAASGTPVVAPVAGTVHWVAYQASAAGHYVVERGTDGRDYVFMHLLAGSVTAVKGAALAAGQPFAAVGSTGDSTGPHLHFEIWPDGWFASDASRPIDPLPDLQAWAATR